jgi:hypothetical protein
MNALSEFIKGERVEYETHDNNLFTFSLGQALRYYNFILIINERYQQASDKALLSFSEMQNSFSDQADGVLSNEQQDMLDKNDQDAELVHLEIESFYLFGKLFLDKVAFFLRDYFGEPRGVSLISHHGLVKYHENFREAKDLIFPDGLSDCIIYLQENIIDYRDDEITHKPNPRNIRGTNYSDGQVGITRIRLYPNERDNQLESSSLSELLSELNKYIELIMILIKTNRDKSRFRLVG